MGLSVVGSRDMLGVWVGCSSWVCAAVTDGVSVGVEVLGTPVGYSVGTTVGSVDGLPVGSAVGCPDG